MSKYRSRGSTIQTQGLKSKLVLVSLFAFALGFALVANGASAQLLEPSPSGATISSDKLDYAPGEQVTLTGAGWADGESVHIVVNDTIGQTWSHTADVTAAADGSFTDVFELPLQFVSDYDVTATGPVSGTATTTFTDAPVSADLDQCRNGGVGEPDVQCADLAGPLGWANGNAGAENAHWNEGESVAYRMRFDGLTVGGANSVVISWDTTDSSTHAFDYLTTYNETETDADPCDGVTGCDLFTVDTETIPDDFRVTNGPDNLAGGGDDIDQIDGVFTLFGGDITSISCPTSEGFSCGSTGPYHVIFGTYTAGTGYSAHTITAVQINFVPDEESPVLAWAGHISDRLDWSPEETAVFINGSPYHMHLEGLDGSGGSQDRSLSANAVIAPGKITIIKNTIPDDAQDFGYTTTGGLSPASFSLDDDADGALSNTQVYSGLTTFGNFTVTETLPVEGFSLTDLDCVVDQVGDPQNETTATGDTGTGVSSVHLGEGGEVTCTYENTKQSRIEIEKQTVPNGDPETFVFTGDVAGTLGDEGSAGENVAPGSYSSTETVPGGWDLTSIVCDDENSSGDASTGVASFEVEAGETVRCVFTNTKHGKIIVAKVTDPSPNTVDSFTFTGDAAGSIKDGETIEVDDLSAGTYTSTEGDPTPGFDLTSIACDDGGSATPSTTSLGTRTATFELDPGETVTCTFTNTQRGMVDVLKITNGAVHPELDIKFTLYRDGPDTDPDLTGTDVQLEELTTLGDADGVLEFTTKLVPGTVYTICENPVPAGWTSMWMIEFNVGGQIVTPYNPNGNDVPPQDLGIRCFDFTVDPGETLHFEVHNDFPGGEPRTIGYWKNWNRCTGGGQDEVADQNGGAAAGFFLVEDLLPQTIGDLTITDCQTAVEILDKSNVNTGKKMASDAAYELAAQLLAARFNLAAGAETCSAVQTAVVDGQNLLANNPINFNGTGSYLGPKVKGSLATLRAQALSLASTLDQYNNGNLC